MKKQILILVLVIVVLGSIYGIYSTARGGQGYFNAVVLETDNELIVKVLPDKTIRVPEELKNAEKIILGEVMANKDLELKVGDKIRVTYNTSSISYEPLKINIVFDIYLLKEIIGSGIDSTSDTATAMTEGAVADIATFKDCTVKVNDTFVPENATDIKKDSVNGDWSVMPQTLETLCQEICKTNGSSIIVGEVVGDIEYRGEYSIEKTTSGRTYYTFAVTDVLYGDNIEAGTLVTIEEQQGFMKSPYSANEYYYFTYCGEPAVKAGDKYVFFINGKEKKDYTEGEIYYSYASFVYKYICCDDGLYRRCSSVIEPLDYWDSETGRYLPEEPMALTEIKDRVSVAVKNITNGMVYEDDNDYSKLSSNPVNETIISAKFADLNHDGKDEILQVVAEGKIEKNKEVVEQFVKDGGVIRFQIKKSDGMSIYNSFRMYNTPSENQQFYLVEVAGKDYLLITSIKENYWMGNFSCSLYEIGEYGLTFAPINNEEAISEPYCKVIKNPLDSEGASWNSAKAKVQEAIAPYIDNAALIVAVDSASDDLVIYSEKDEQIPASEYLDKVWVR